MTEPPTIQTPDDEALDELCAQLRERSDQVDFEDAWPGDQLDLCGRYGVYRWFVPEECGGLDWSEADIYRGYLKLSAACLTTTFIITQRSGACRRIAFADNEPLKEELLPDLVSGASFATVGISHLTTSRRHLAKPVLSAKEVDDGFVLDGFSPWVTGGDHAQTVVTGATMEDGRQVLVALPTDLPGVSADEYAKLVGLTASHTGPVRCDNVFVDRRWLLAGPIENVMSLGVGAKSGGLQTSALAVGLSSAAVAFLEEEATRRSDLSAPTGELRRDQEKLEADLLSMAVGREVCSFEQLRVRANSLALRSTQAALAAAKGTGYVVGHPAGRWCREALFFLVWSCPQPVMAANLCELAGISD